MLAEWFSYRSTGAAKSHYTYFRKLTTQKKSYRDYVVNGYSTNVEDIVLLIRSDEPVLSENNMTPNVKEMVQDSAIPMKIAHKSFKLGRQLGICIVENKSPTIQKIARSLRKKMDRQT